MAAGGSVGVGDVISLRADVVGNATGHHGVVQLVLPGGDALVASLCETGALGKQVEHVRQLSVLPLQLLAFVGKLTLLASQSLQHGVHVATGRREFTL